MERKDRRRRSAMAGCVAAVRNANDCAQGRRRALPLSAHRFGALQVRQSLACRRLSGAWTAATQENPPATERAGGPRHKGERNVQRLSRYGRCLRLASGGDCPFAIDPVRSAMMRDLLALVPPSSLEAQKNCGRSASGSDGTKMRAVARRSPCG